MLFKRCLVVHPHPVGVVLQRRCQMPVSRRPTSAILCPRYPGFFRCHLSAAARMWMSPWSRQTLTITSIAHLRRSTCPVTIIYILCKAAGCLFICFVAPVGVTACCCCSTPKSESSSSHLHLHEKRDSQYGPFLDYVSYVSTSNGIKVKSREPWCKSLRV